MKVKLCVLQFERAGKFRENVKKAVKLLEKSDDPDFVLFGGEFSLNESSKIDPYPTISEIAKSFKTNIVAPVNANPRRFPNLRRKEKGYSSMHVFNRKGKAVAIQDKQHFYWRERPWFKRGHDVRVFRVDGVRVGLARGLDILYPEYTQRLAGAELIFFSTMAVDDMMLDLAKARSVENQCYVAMSSYMAWYFGMNFLGNAAVIEPHFHIDKGMRRAAQSKVLKHTTEEGLIEAELDMDYIRKIKKDYSMEQL